MSANGKPEFVHLHNHSEYSLMDGIIRLSDHHGGPGEALKRLQAEGAKGFALTDHGNMYGAIEFYQHCTKLGLNPIVGCEMYFSKGKLTDRGHSQKENCHLTVLARNYEGYQNLMQLVTTAFLEGYYYDPRADKELLAKHSKGLVVLSGCLKSELSQLILTGNLVEAERLACWYRDQLEPGAFFLEIMDHGLDKQRQVLKALLELHERTKIPLVATNDCHYAKPEDVEAQDARVCIATGRKIDDPPTTRLKFDGKDYYIKSAEEMHKIFSFAPEALTNTLKIHEMCHLKIPMDSLLLPEFSVPEGYNQDTYLEDLCLKGLKERLGEVRPEYRERLSFELGVIRKMGFSGYFLIVWDFIKHARSIGVPVGPGRGSGAGALVAYSLRITNIDPLPNNLLFERFLNPDRKSMPDLDIDFADTGRDRIIDYVRNKYGASNVAQIITFGSLGAKLVVRDVARVMNLPVSEGDRIAKMIPGGPGVTLYEAMKSPEMASAAKDPQIKKLLDLSLRLEGLKRHTGVHAAGTLITKEPVVKYSPLAKGKNEVVTTQYDGDYCPKLGLLKVDFLGLRTLSIIDDAIKFIKERKDPKFDIDAIPMDDEKSYALLRSGKALAVFQLDSSGMRDLLVRIKPTRFEDIVALIALYRPGPMQSGMLDMFVDRKHGKEKVSYDHALMESVLKDTYGCIVFQEQVMEISKKLADFTPGQADGLRKAMGKKIPEEMEKMRDTFVKGAGNHKVSAKMANKIFDQLVQFGGYGFNKCLVGSTRIPDAETGLMRTIGELARSGNPVTVWSLGEDLKGKETRASRVWSNGAKPIFRLKTRLGKEIVATDNHPFLAFGGWTTLGNLKPGDRIASPRQVPAGPKRWPDHQAALLGWTLSEGNVCHPAGFYLYSTDALQAQDMIRCAEAFENTATTLHQRRGLNEIHVRASDTGNGQFKKGHRKAAARSGARAWLEGLGLIDCKATEKFIPAGTFGLSAESLAVFLGRLWSGDGFIYSKTNTLPFYATSSRQMARDLQELLLRLGIVSRIHEKQFSYRGGYKPGFAIVLIGRTSIENFARQIGPQLIGRNDQLQALLQALKKVSGDLTSKDTIPVGIRELVRTAKVASGARWRAVEAATDVCTKDFQGSRVFAKKRGFRRWTIRSLAEYFQSAELMRWADADIFWDTIDSIEPAGEEETFDLEAPGTHNFVAEGLFVHNSHSAAYGLVAYQTAYLKANYPIEFMAAVATSEIGHSAIGNEDKENKLVTYLEEARNMGITILPPDVQKSGARFTIEDPNAIRFGLVAIKNVGEGAVDSLIAARQDGPFKDLDDFCARVDLHAANKKVLESLVKAGAMDSLDPADSPGGKRARLLKLLEHAVDRQAAIREDKARGQELLFEMPSAAPANGASTTLHEEVSALSEHDVLNFEKEVLGFYFSGHPLLSVREKLKAAATKEIAQLAPNLPSPVRVAGLMTQVKRMVTKSKGEQMAKARLEDLSGEIDLLVFPRAYASGLDKQLKVGSIICASGRLSFRGESAEGGCELIVEEILPIDMALLRYGRKLRVKAPEGLDESLLEKLRMAFANHPGNCPVALELDTPEGTAVLETEQKVRLEQNLLESIEEILGQKSWRIENAS